MKKIIDPCFHKNILKTTFSTTGWALCIGAGSSYPIFPDWKQLVEKLILTTNPDKAKLITDFLFKNYNADSIIHAAYNILEIDDVNFVGKLVDLLYSNIKNDCSDEDFKLICNFLYRPHPEQHSFEQWKSFISIRESYFSKASAYNIARVISKTINTDAAPSEIISFNGEPLLLSLLNSFICENFYKTNPAPDKTPPRYVDLRNRSISNYHKNRISYILNHGQFPIPCHEKSHFQSSVDKLVFREGEYLSLANSSFSWQSSTFLQISSSKPIVFLGVSLSDNNMRRWLTWVQDNRNKEIFSTSSENKYSTRHFWVCKKENDIEYCEWLSSIVFHLGVRIIWVDDWSHIEIKLEEMLGLSK